LQEKRGRKRRLTFHPPWSRKENSGRPKEKKRKTKRLEPLIQLVKTGFTKVAQRLDGIYALLLVGKIAAVDIKAGMVFILLFF
jgi:hypothetical protein